MLNLGNQSIAVFALALVVSSCSMKDRDVNYGVSVSFPNVARSGFADNAVIDGTTTTNGNGFITPTSLADFQCFALNITGPGLKSDPRFGCNDPAKGMGLIAGMAPVSGGRVEAMVPAGASRTIQLIGLQSTVGCPSFEELLSRIDPTTGHGGMDGVGDAYLLGQTTIDVFGDVTVNIQAQFDPNAKMFNGCDGGGGQKTLVFSSPNERHVVLRGSNACVPFQIEAHGHYNVDTVMPAVVPTIGVIVPFTGYVALYTDSQCNTLYTDNPSASPAPSPLQFAATQGFIPLWIRVSPEVTSFTAQAVSTSTEWLQPTVTYQAVDQMIGVTPMPSPGTCASLSVRLIDQGGLFTNMPTGKAIDMRVYNNTTNGSTYSSTEFYLDAVDCANQRNKLSPQALSNGDHQLKYLFSFTNGSNLYIRNPVTEHVNISFSGTDDAIAPSNMSYTF
ncbi:MAG: hypothetical protein JST80_01780 [Bdellovibrionales bacterium]|nr:hypothetical protein [Bdellovibrionales bacterium]